MVSGHLDGKGFGVKVQLIIHEHSLKYKRFLEVKYTHVATGLEQPWGKCNVQRILSKMLTKSITVDGWTALLPGHIG